MLFPASALAFALALAFLPEPLPDLESLEPEFDFLPESGELERESLPFSDFFKKLGVAPR